MLPLFVQEALPAAVFWTLVVAWALTELRGYRTRRAGTRAQDAASLRFIILGVWGGIALGSLVTLTVEGATLPAYRELAFWLGIAFLAAGVALRQFAVRALGRLWVHEVAIQAEHEVVEAGPYRWIRHPAYSGSLLGFIGVGLAMGNWAALLVIAAIPMLAYAYRVSVEERALAAALGDEYRAYMRRTRRFIPFLF
jgi:protein-S-isoprenylcysteine O-methyltransferase